MGKQNISRLLKFLSFYSFDFITYTHMFTDMFTYILLYLGFWDV